MIDSSSTINEIKLHNSISFDSAPSDVKPKNEVRSLMKRKRTVRFHPLISVKETLNITDYTPPEIARCWYSETELAQHFSEVKEILTNPKVLPDDPEYCCAMWRGLEGMTPQGWKRRQENKKAGWAAVKRNSRNSSYGPSPCSSIALAYRLTTQLAVLEAKKRATDEEYFSTERITSKTKDPKQSPTINLSAWNLHPRRVGTQIQEILQRITGH